MTYYLILWRERGTVWRCHPRLTTDYEAARRLRDHYGQRSAFTLIYPLEANPDSLIHESARHGRQG